VASLLLLLLLDVVRREMLLALPARCRVRYRRVSARAVKSIRRRPWDNHGGLGGLETPPLAPRTTWRRPADGGKVALTRRETCPPLAGQRQRRGRGRVAGRREEEVSWGRNDRLGRRCAVHCLTVVFIGVSRRRRSTAADQMLAAIF